MGLLLQKMKITLFRWLGDHFGRSFFTQIQRISQPTATPLPERWNLMKQILKILIANPPKPTCTDALYIFLGRNTLKKRRNFNNNLTRPHKARGDLISFIIVKKTADQPLFRS